MVKKSSAFAKLLALLASMIFLRGNWPSSVFAKVTCVVFSTLRRTTQRPVSPYHKWW